MAALRIEISTGAGFFVPPPPSHSLFLRLLCWESNMRSTEPVMVFMRASLTHTCMCTFLTQGWQIEEVELKLPSPTQATTSQWCNSTCTCVYVCLTDDSLVANGLRFTEDLIKAYIFPFFFHQFISILCNLQKQACTHTQMHSLHLNWGWWLTVYHVLLLSNAAVTSCKYECTICPPDSAFLPRCCCSSAELLSELLRSPEMIYFSVCPLKLRWVSYEGDIGNILLLLLVSLWKTPAIKAGRNFELFFVFKMLQRVSSVFWNNVVVWLFKEPLLSKWPVIYFLMGFYNSKTLVLVSTSISLVFLFVVLSAVLAVDISKTAGKLLA